MKNSNPKLKFFLAKSALMHFYRNQYWTSDEIHILNNFFGVNNSERMWKLKMRLLWEENLLFAIKQILALKSDKLGYRIIRTKILNPHIYFQKKFFQEGKKLVICPDRRDRDYSYCNECDALFHDPALVDGLCEDCRKAVLA